MSTSLYERFSTAMMSLPEADLLDTVGQVDIAVERACRTTKADGVFETVGDVGRSDGVFRVLSGRTVAEVADVMRKFRGELADELARRGTPADLVREMREGGPQPDGLDVVGRT